MRKNRMYCPKCRHNVLAEQTTANHIFHLFMTILTGGFWLIIWLCAGLSNTEYRCPFCGSETEKPID